MSSLDDVWSRLGLPPFQLHHSEGRPLLQLVGCRPVTPSKARSGRSACGGPNSPTRILPLYSPDPCFVLPASTYQSAPLSSPTVSDRFLPRGPQHGFNATCDER